MIESLKAYIARPEVRASLYRVAIAVSVYLAARYAIDGNLLAIVNGLLAVVFGVAHANVPTPDPEPFGDAVP